MLLEMSLPSPDATTRMLCIGRIESDSPPTFDEAESTLSKKEKKTTKLKDDVISFSVLRIRKLRENLFGGVCGELPSVAASRP
jgi:hypothetical protein